MAQPRELIWLPIIALAAAALWVAALLLTGGLIVYPVAALAIGLPMVLNGPAKPGVG